MHSGLGLHPKTPQFLAEAYGMRALPHASGIPVFEMEDRTYLGGTRSFYTILDRADDAQKIIRETRKSLGSFEACFATSDNWSGSRLATVILSIPEGTAESDRAVLYGKKVRNQVRRAREDALELVYGFSLDGWYESYEASVSRLGGRPKSRRWFEALLAAYGDDVLCVNAIADGRIVGSNLAVRSGQYLALLFNISDPTFWDRRVNDLLYDELVRQAILRGIRLVDFGPSLRSDASHLHFKRGFGGETWYIANAFFGTPLARLRELFRKAAARFRR